MSFLPGLGWASGIEGRASGRICTSPAAPRLPVSRGDLKGRGRKDSQPGRGATPEFGSPPDRPAGAFCSLRFVHSGSGTGRKAGGGGSGSDPRAQAGKMATPPADRRLGDMVGDRGTRTARLPSQE